MTSAGLNGVPGDDVGHVVPFVGVESPAMCRPETIEADAGSDFSWLIDVVVPVGGVVLAGLLGAGTALFVQWWQRRQDTADEDLRRRTELATQSVRALTLAAQVGAGNDRQAEAINRAVGELRVFALAELRELPSLAHYLSMKATWLHGYVQYAKNGSVSATTIAAIGDEIRDVLTERIRGRFDDALPLPVTNEEGATVDSRDDADGSTT